MERSERLPEPVRDRVIERAQSAIKRVDAAHQAAEAEVNRLEQEVWRREKAARR